MSAMSAEWRGLYSTAQVSRLARIPISTLYEWRRRGIILPSLELIECGLVADEGYSYSDLTLVRIIKGLRDKHLDFDSAFMVYVSIQKLKNLKNRSRNTTVKKRGLSSYFAMARLILTIYWMK